MRVIAFVNRGLTKSKANYPAHKLEFLALKWAVTSKYSDYLYGGEFTVITDCNPLTYILTSAKLDGTWSSSRRTPMAIRFYPKYLKNGLGNAKELIQSSKK